MLEKAARLIEKDRVCARLRVPTVSRCANADPSEAAKTAGQHQAPIMAGMAIIAMQPEPQSEAKSSFRGTDCSETSSPDGSSQPPSPHPPAWYSATLIDMARQLQPVEIQCQT